MPIDSSFEITGSCLLKVGARTVNASDGVVVAGIVVVGWTMVVSDRYSW